MQFDTKLAIAIKGALVPWQALNVAGFLAGGLAGSDIRLLGEPYRDAEGVTYSALIREPIFVFTATPEELQRTRRRAIDRSLTTAVYTEEMFATDHDAANRAAVADFASDQLALVGVAVHGPRRDVDKVVKGLKRHP